MAKEASNVNSSTKVFTTNQSMMLNFSTRAADTSTNPAFLKIPWNSNLNIAICAFGLFLNVTEIITLLRRVKKLTVFELYLLSLAFADSMVLVAIVVFESTILNMPVYNAGYIATTYGLDENSKMPAMRILIEATKRFSGYSSAAILLLIGLDRFTAIWYPFRHRVWVTKKRACKVIGYSLSICLVCSLLEMMLSLSIGWTVKKYWSKIDACLILLMVLVISVLYTLIVYKVVKKSKARRKYTGNSCRSNSDVKSAVEVSCEETEVIITCCLVVLAYDACTLPYAMETLLELSHKNFLFVFVALYMNTVMDPLIYFFKGFLTKQLKRRRRKMLLKKLGEKSSDLGNIEQQACSCRTIRTKV